MIISDEDSVVADPLESLMGYQMRRASSVMMADLAKSLALTGLRPVEASILLVIRSSPGCTQSDVGRTLGVKRANMVPLIAALAKMELVYRSPVDGRSQALFLTATGETMVDAVHQAMTQHEARFQSRFSPEILETLFDAFKTIRSAPSGDGA